MIRSSATALVTGSRLGDVALLVVLTAALLALAPGFRVYHSITVAEVTGTRLAPDGRREALAVPAALTKTRPMRPSELLAELERRIAAHTRALGEREVPADTRFEWTIRYAPSSLRLDRERTIVLGPDGRPR